MAATAKMNWRKRKIKVMICTDWGTGEADAVVAVIDEMVALTVDEFMRAVELMGVAWIEGEVALVEGELALMEDVVVLIEGAVALVEIAVALMKGVVLSTKEVASREGVRVVAESLRSRLFMGSWLGIIPLLLFIVSVELKGIEEWTSCCGDGMNRDVWFMSLL
jgi:hypothetical protein